MEKNFLENVTPVVLTYNEAPNIGRVLDKLGWAHEVVVVDSGSDDGTLEILRDYPNVRLVHRAFDRHAAQWNFAISNTGIASGWVLALDADYMLTDELIAEISSLSPSEACAGYLTTFRYCVYGKPLRGSLYPPVMTLYRRSAGSYVQDGHTQRLILRGDTEILSGVILHDDRKSLGRWLWSQDRYATLEAQMLLAQPFRNLRLQDKLRRMLVITPWLVPIYCLTVGRGLLDGWVGIYYAFQRGIAEALLSLKLIERKFFA